MPLAPEMLLFAMKEQTSALYFRECWYDLKVIFCPFSERKCIFSFIIISTELIFISIEEWPNYMDSQLSSQHHSLIRKQ